MGAQQNAPKKVLVTLFPYIFYLKTKWNIVYEYLKTKTFSRDTNIIPQKHWTANIFGHSVTTIERFWASLNNPILNFKKMVCPKNIWMWHPQPGVPQVSHFNVQWSVVDIFINFTRFNWTVHDLWLTTWFWIFMTEFYVIMSFFSTRSKDINNWNYLWICDI